MQRLRGVTSLRTDLALQVRIVRYAARIESRQQIAERMGYSEAANFSRAFQKLTGRTPSSLRT